LDVLCFGSPVAAAERLFLEGEEEESWPVVRQPRADAFGRKGGREGGREGERRGSGVCVCVFVVCVCRVCVRVCLLPLVLMLLLSLTTLSTLPTLSRTHLCTAVLGVDNASYVAWACNRAFSSFSLALVLLPLFFLGGSV